jgi:EAL domain-containing protein (putative c-di-GMP-specific phosphodiesterase class I)
MTVRNIGVHLVQGFFLHKPGSGTIGHKPGIAAVKSA